MGCFSGGGSAGKVEFAVYLENAHLEWLGGSEGTPQPIDNTIVDIMNSLFTTTEGVQPNPYTDAEAFNAKPLVDEILTQARKVTSSDGYLNSDATHTTRPLTALNEWSSIIASARGTIDSSSVSKVAEDITDLVSSIFTVAVANATAATLQTITDSKTHTDTIVDGAISKALDVINSQPVKDTIKVFSESISEETNTIKARFSAGMAEANATMSSAFIFGNSNIENARLKAIERFTTDLVNRLYNQVVLDYISSAVNLTTLETQSFSNLFNSNLRGQVPFNMQARQVRDSRVDLHTQLISNMMFANIANELMVPQMYAKALGISIIALSERDKENVRYEAEEKMWDLKVYNAGAGILGGMSTGGGTFIPEGASQVSSTISGALGGSFVGAKIGAEIGVAGGPIGATAGAGIGLVLGGIAGYNE